jgi:hypothetical protein
MISRQIPTRRPKHCITAVLEETGQVAMLALYHPPISGDTIRLFQLSLLRDGTISATLRNFSLGANNCPSFIATSYTWDSEEDSKENSEENSKKDSKKESSFILLNDQRGEGRRRDRSRRRGARAREAAGRRRPPTRPH